MSEAAPAPAAVPAKAPKRRSTKAKKTGPSVSDLIVKVVSASKDRKGISLAALKKGLSAAGYDVAKNSFRVRLAVRRLLANGGLTQTKGTGASGSFKIGEKAAKKKALKKAKKPLAKKAKRTRAKKPAAAKKSPKKTKRKTKSPRKAKKPVTKKTKSPRKSTRRAKAPAKQQ
ncbi:histone H1 [Salminus brasiliensis]|uniref:histone H1 n=1 Tax=Salminus brasiliensis TaxID=930266 RepID=UPI003B83074B